MRKTAISHLVLALPFGLLACNGGNTATGEDPVAVDSALASPFGGMTEIDELPAFGDPALASPAYQTEDATVTDTTTDNRPDLTNAQHVRVAVVWGLLPPDPAAEEVVDWSGSIVAENAAVRVLRKLSFEDSDVILRPRPDIYTISFQSKTKPAADGLLLDVILAPTLNPEEQPVTLTFATAPYTHTLTLEPGMQMSDVATVDDAGHKVAYRVFPPGGNGCAAGMMRGQWKRVDGTGGALGVLRGRMMAADGELRGMLRGVFGVRDDGTQAWFAKVIDTQGNFIGIIAGRYADGRFAGLLLGQGKTILGRVHGMYFDADSNGDGRFLGRWSQRCGEDPAEGTPTTTDEPNVPLDDGTSSGS